MQGVQRERKEPDSGGRETGSSREKKSEREKERKEGLRALRSLAILLIWRIDRRSIAHTQADANACERVTALHLLLFRCLSFMQPTLSLTRSHTRRHRRALLSGATCVSGSTLGLRNHRPSGLTHTRLPPSCSRRLRRSPLIDHSLFLPLIQCRRHPALPSAEFARRRRLRCSQKLAQVR